MFKKLFIEILPFIIIISIFGYVMTYYLGIIQIPYILKIENYGTNMYYYDINGYLQNIENAWKNIQLLRLELPTRTWQNIDITNWGNALANNVALLFDWLYMPLNVVLYPVRLLAWIVRNILTILGCVYTTTTYNGITYNPMWFMTTLNWISSNLAIPYI